MNIAFLTYEIADEGGNFIRSFSLARELISLGHRVTLIASNKISRLKPVSYTRDGVIIIEAPSVLFRRIRHNGTSPLQILFRSAYLCTHRFDVVHAFGHRPSVFIPTIISRFRFKTPYVADWADLWGWQGLASYRGGVWGRITGALDDWAERVAYQHADGVTVISDYLFKRSIQNNISRNRLTKIVIGADTKDIKVKDKRLMRQKHHIPGRTPVVVFVGNAPYDAPLLAHSFVEIVRRKPNTILLFVGRQMNEFKKIIMHNNLQDHVKQFGFVPHAAIDELLACGDVMLLPYTDRPINRGRFPNKLGDYMAAGKPIVTNSTGDLAAIFKKYEIGLAVKESPRAMATGVIWLFNHPDKAQKMGQAAHALAVGELSWNTQAKKLVQFYYQILGKYGSSGSRSRRASPIYP